MQITLFLLPFIHSLLSILFPAFASTYASAANATAFFTSPSLRFILSCHLTPQAIGFDLWETTPAFKMFGSNSGSSVFGQQPAFGGFGVSTPSSPFGSTLNQSQPSFGSNSFGSSAPFGASSQPSFGASAAPSFGSASTPSFGASSTPASGSTSTSTFGTSAFGSGGAFGTSNTPAFGSSSTPAFGASNVPSFGATSSPSFGGSSTPAFGAGSTPAFGNSAAPVFGAGSTPAFGAGSTPTFGASSTPSFNFGSAPSFGQTSSPFGSTPSFGAPSSAFGSQTAAPTFSSGFGQSAPGIQQGGSRIAPYTATPEADSGTQTPGKLESISAMPVYKEKSHEEIRWEDYQRGDKGGPNPAGQPTPGIGFGASSVQSSPFASSSTFGQSSSNPFSSPASSTPFSTPASNPFATPASSNQFSTPASSNQFSAPASSNPFSAQTPSNPFASNPSAIGSTGFGTSSSAFGSSSFGTSNTTNTFGASSAPATSLFTAPSTSAFNSNTSSLFGTSISSAFGSSPSLFSSATAQGTNPTFGSGINFSSTPAQTFQSTTPSFGQTGGAFGQSGLSFGQSSAGQSSLFNAPSFGGGIFSSSSSQLSTSNPMGFGQTTPTLSTPLASTQSAQTSSSFSFGNFNQTQPSIGAFGGGSNMFGQNPGQVSTTQSSAMVQSVQNPFGVLPPVPQMSTGHAGLSPSIQYGISSMPVVDKPVPIRISSILTSRHLSQRRIKLPARNEDENMSSTPKADAVFIPRENPRALIIQQKDRLPTKVDSDRSFALNGINYSRHENGKMAHEESNHMPNGSKAAYKEKTAADGEMSKEQNHPNKASQYSNGIHADHQNRKGDSYISLTGHRAGEAAIVYEHGADIEALMPKLRHSDYYTEPRIQELAAKERAEPGYCTRVHNFVVGRHGFGSIKFLGDTDVRRLDLESLIQFNNREVIVYMDDTKKPPVGQGLNKPAEVTLLNIKCYDKKTGQQYIEGLKIEKYKEMLRRKAENQGAEFLSYEPINGEWKFKVRHFSSYKLDEDED
ncbi:hypothetical protein V2J09_013646 [Rumex salicifolius]